MTVCFQWLWKYTLPVKGVEKANSSQGGRVLERKRRGNLAAERSIYQSCCFLSHHSLLFSVISFSYHFIWITINKMTCPLSSSCSSLSLHFVCQYTAVSPAYLPVNQRNFVISCNRPNWPIMKGQWDVKSRLWLSPWHLYDMNRHQVVTKSMHMWFLYFYNTKPDSNTV